jgi:hypothetical protein
MQMIDEEQTDSYWLVYEFSSNVVAIDLRTYTSNVNVVQVGATCSRNQDHLVNTELLTKHKPYQLDLIDCLYFVHAAIDMERNFDV